jgi:trehalose/maltose hydrolase-like predicted phosphorylase
MEITATNPNNWQVLEDQFEIDRQHHRETIFTLGNGYLATRGTFEERYPGDRQATLVHGLWDDIPISFTELANAPDWTALEIWINGQRFSMDKGEVRAYQRHLDLRTGVLQRTLEWSPDEGETWVALTFERFASLADQHVLAVQATIIPMTGPVDIRVRSTLDSHVNNEGYLHWQPRYQHSTPHQADLVVQTKKTEKKLAMSTRLILNSGEVQKSFSDARGGPGIEAQVSELPQEQMLIIQKFVGVATSRDLDTPLTMAQDKAFNASKAGYESIRFENQKAWADFWKISAVRIVGDLEAQLALRHALFQLRIAAPTTDEKVSIGAKSLSGFGYRGHVFWDTEIFILPFFTLTQPDISRNMLRYRYHTLAGARRKAAANSYAGAQYAWESADTGAEVTPKYVPDFHDPGKLVRIWTGDIEVHITADIAYALHQYWQMTGDDNFWMNIGIPIVLETAIFWADRAEPEQVQSGAAGEVEERFSIRDIIGPDEYHEHVDNNPFTNRMAQWHLDLALQSLEWLRKFAPEKLTELESTLNINYERRGHWANVRDNLVILQNPESGLFEQFEGFFELEDLDWSEYADRTQSMQELLTIEGANQSQVIKQADVIMLLCLLRNEFSKETWQTNWDYYNPRTDHSYGSSLGPAMQAWAACEMGEPDLAYEHFMRAARADLVDVRGNANDGVHAASAGGLWQAVAFGFAGLNFVDGQPTINPRLPSHWERLSFKIKYHGKTYNIDIHLDQATITAAEIEERPGLSMPQEVTQ